MNILLDVMAQKYVAGKLADSTVEFNSSIRGSFVSYHNYGRTIGHIAAQLSRTSVMRHLKFPGMRKQITVCSFPISFYWSALFLIY